MLHPSWILSAPLTVPVGQVAGTGLCKLQTAPPREPGRVPPSVGDDRLELAALDACQDPPPTTMLTPGAVRQTEGLHVVSQLCPRQSP